MLNLLTIDEYLNEFSNVPLIDVRSPGEFNQAHIPGAISIPLFTNEERAAIGTVYKRRSREEAMALGYDFVEPKREHLFNQSKAASSSKGIAIHCWRGGMRSRLFAEYLVQHGLQNVYLIEGGYKAYRRSLIASFERTHCLYSLGGYTGSGKTEILHEIKKLGQQVVDLEGYACHKGSAFGGIGETCQPTTEQFENRLFAEWRTFDPSQPIWIEDESRTIGSVVLPSSLFAAMRAQPVCFINIPRDERTKFLVNRYGSYPKEQLAAAFDRITKKLGGQNAQHALELLEKGDLEAATNIALYYYDKLYEKGVSRRDASLVFELPLQTVDPVQNAQLILKHVERKHNTRSTHSIQPRRGLRM